MATTRKPAAKKSAPAKKTATKPVSKTIAKKPASTPSKAYHVSKHDDGGWKVKGAGSEKAVKKFATQKEAIEHANKLAKNQDGHVKVHSKSGKLRSK